MRKIFKKLIVYGTVKRMNLSLTWLAIRNLGDSLMLAFLAAVP